MADFLETTVDKFIFKVATDRAYSSQGIWAIEEANGRIRLGVSDYQQQLNGDVAFVHLKPVGTRLVVDDEFAEVETIKATVSFLSPIAGTIVELNGDLELKPELVNLAPYDHGWLAVIEATNWKTDRTALLGADAYLAAMRSQAEEELKK